MSLLYPSYYAYCSKKTCIVLIVFWLLYQSCRIYNYYSYDRKLRVFLTIQKITPKSALLSLTTYTVPMILVSFRLSPTWLFCFNNSTRLIDNHSKTRIWQLRHMKSSLRLTIWYLSYGSCRLSFLTRGTSPKFGK